MSEFLKAVADAFRDDRYARAGMRRELEEQEFLAAYYDRLAEAARRDDEPAPGWPVLPGTDDNPIAPEDGSEPSLIPRVTIHGRTITPGQPRSAAPIPEDDQRWETYPGEKA